MCYFVEQAFKLNTALQKSIHTDAHSAEQL